MNFGLLSLSIGASYGWYYCMLFINDKNTFLYTLYIILCSGIGTHFCYLFFHDLLNQIEKTTSTPYEEFIEKYYEDFKEIIEDIDVDKKEYENEDESYLKSLKERENHYESELPFEYNSALFFFYHAEEERFHYYTKGDVTHPILNTVCRGYVIENKCIQLFKDEADLSRIQKMIDKDYENISDKEVEEEEEEEEEESSSIFYFKAFNKKQKKKKTIKQKVINPFIRKGNLQDYEVDYPKQVVFPTRNVKEINYEAFKQLVKQSLKSS